MGVSLLVVDAVIGHTPQKPAEITVRFGEKLLLIDTGMLAPVYSGKPYDSRLLTGCYLNSLTLAVENNLKTIAFPAISCGVYGYPIEAACKIAVDTTCSILETTPTLTRVVFMLFSPADLKVYEAYIQFLAKQHQTG